MLIKIIGGRNVRRDNFGCAANIKPSFNPQNTNMPLIEAMRRDVNIGE